MAYKKYSMKERQAFWVGFLSGTAGALPFVEPAFINLEI